MTMTLDAAELAAALRAGGRLDSVSQRRAVRLVATDNAVTVLMADLNQSLAVTISAPAPAGEFVIDRHFLEAALKGAKAGAALTVEPHGVGARLTVETPVGRKATRVPLIEWDAPEPPVVAGDPVVIGFRELKRLLSAIKCAEPPKGRYHLAGVHLTVRDKNLHAEVTDGKMLSIVRSDTAAPEDWGVSQDRSGILMAHESVGLIAALPIDEGDVIGLASNGNAWKLTGEKVTAVGKLVDGAFPDIEVFFRTDPTTSAVLDTAAMKTALESTDPLTTEDKKNRGVFLGVRDGVLTIVGGGFDRESISHARVDVDCNTDGPPVWMWVNSALIQALLSLHQSETLRILYRQDDALVVLDDGGLGENGEVGENPPTDRGALGVLRGNAWPEWQVAEAEAAA